MFHKKSDLLHYMKKPGNPYICFVKQRLPILKKEHPSSSMASLNKEIASEWRSKDKEEKAFFIKEY
jgi:hypothetical protein